MIKKVFPYLLIVLFLWYLPELFVSSNNLSSYIFREGTARPNNKVDIKVVKKVPYLPEKYSVLNRGERDIRVELLSNTTVFSRSIIVSDDGLAHFEGIPFGDYDINVGQTRSDLFPDDIQKIEVAGESVFYNQATFPLTTNTISVRGDVFLATILQ